MRRHRRWIIPLSVTVTAPLLGYGLLYWGYMVSAEDRAEQWVVGVASLLIVVVPLVGLIWTLAGVVGTYRRSARHQRKLDHQRSQAVERIGGPASTQADYQAGYGRAAQMCRVLSAGGQPAALQSHTVMTAQGERILWQMQAEYRRFYGQDVTYGQGGVFAIGPPLFTIGMLAGSAVANRGARKNAEALAAAQWREFQYSPVLVTDRRLVIHANGQWLSFYYGALTAVYPEADQFTLVLDFEGAEPLRLEGPDVPTAALLVIYCTQGPHAVATHPSLGNLRQLEGGSPEAAAVTRGG